MNSRGSFWTAPTVSVTVTVTLQDYYILDSVRGQSYEIEYRDLTHAFLSYLSIVDNAKQTALDWFEENRVSTSCIAPIAGGAVH